MYRYSTKLHNYRALPSLLSILIILSLLFAPVTTIFVQAEELTSEEVEQLTEEVDETPAAPAEIITGDAVSISETETVANLNETTVSQDEPLEEEITETAKDTNQPSEDILELSQELSADALIPENVSDAEVVASTTNEAVVSNVVSTIAETGSNNALGEDSLIITGDAIAYANVVNVVNTNIFNSEGIIAFFNEVLGINSIDLRDAFSVFDDVNTSMSTLPCSPLICGESGAPNYSVEISNDATITNDVVVRADSGGNAAGDGGLIDTGDAYAAANIFNLANTNITDSNYLLLSFNNFGDYAGDIVLPGADILNSLFSAGGSSLSNSQISSTNTASIENNISTEAETGGNSAEGGLIATGDASAYSSVENIVNTNLFGGSDFLLVLRIHGDWNGEIFGLPEGLSWAETENGIAIYNTDADGSNVPTGNTSLTSTNSAVIKNNVSVYALTGENKVGSGGVIQTGDAYASSNITNVANTNVLGQNWALLIFDIFGDWSGNLAFGRPDLWIGGKAESPSSPIMPGNAVTYTYTVTNNGDATATNVKLDHLFNEGELVYMSDASRVQYGSNGTYGAWSLGNIAPHETKEITFTTKVNNNLGRDKREIVSRAIVTAHEPDADESDNTELLSIFAGKKSSGGSSRKATPKANIEVIKSANVEAVTPGGSVDYTITLTNHGGPLYKSLVRDFLTNENGEITSEQYWDLGTILPNETISVSYTMQFADDATFGTYINTADVVGLTGYITLQKGTPYESPKANHTIKIGDITPEVLGIMTEACIPYLTSYMKYGAENSEQEVTKLQEFLRAHMGSPISVTGIFDLTTEIAVRAFQQRYANEILYPWGLTKDSGFVYYTTQKKINEIQCGNSVHFPLSSSQAEEVLRFKSLMNGFSTISSAKLTDKENPAFTLLKEQVKLSDPITLKDNAPTKSPTQPNLLSRFKEPFITSLQWIMHHLHGIALR